MKQSQKSFYNVITGLLVSKQLKSLRTEQGEKEGAVLPLLHVFVYSSNFT